MGKTITTYLIEGNTQGAQYVFISNKICKMLLIPRANISIINLKNFLSSYNNKGQLKDINISLDSFVQKNDKKIKTIFIENRQAFKINIFLSQPRIFLIWYLIEKFEFILKDNWQNYYNIDDLNELVIWWGKSVA